MGDICNNCGGDILKCTHPQTPKTRTITVDRAHAQEGDNFSGTYTGADGTVVTAAGKLKNDGSVGRLYVSNNLPYLRHSLEVDPLWVDVTITREVPIQTRTEAMKALPEGTIFELAPGTNTWLRTKRGFKVLANSGQFRGDIGHEYELGDIFGTATYSEEDFTLIHDPKEGK